MYNNLIELYKKGELDFSQVKSFNLDEYYPIAKSNENSYDYFMNDVFLFELLFKSIHTTG